MKNRLYYAAVALVLAASAFVFAARSGALAPQARGFVLYQKTYTYDREGRRRLDSTAVIYYNHRGSRLEVISHEGGGSERKLWSAEDGAVYHITRKRVYRVLDYVPIDSVKGESVVVGGIAAVRRSPKQIPADGNYVVPEFAPGLQNALIGLRHFQEGRLMISMETTGLDLGEPPAELFTLPPGLPVEAKPSPFSQ